MQQKGIYKLQMKRLIYILCCLFLLQLPTDISAQQTYERRLSVSEWIEEMVNCEDSVYILENAEIYRDFQRDTLYLTWYNRSSLDSILKSKQLVINASIWIKKCLFPNDIMLHIAHIDFKGYIAFWECKNFWGKFLNCNFYREVQIFKSALNSIRFSHCLFTNTVDYRNSEINGLIFNNCIFTQAPNQNHQFLCNIDNSTIGEFEFSYCVIKPLHHDDSGKMDEMEKQKFPLIFRIKGYIGALIIDNINFLNTIVDFEGALVTKTLVVNECKFTHPIGLESFTFPQLNTNFDWYLLEGFNICLWDGYDSPPYLANTDSQLAYTYNYKELMSLYNKFYNMYKGRGDRPSANASYIEMKELETRRLNYLYRQDPSMNNFFQWRMNQFLKTFCDYGTSPVESLIISLYVVLAFALFYFFFYSDWDRISRTFLIRKYRKMMKYFGSEQKLEDFYSEEHREEFQSYAEFKKEMDENSRFSLI